MKYVASLLLSAFLSLESAAQPPAFGTALMQAGPPSAAVPEINSAGVVNGASFSAMQPPVPGSIATIFGVNLSASTDSVKSLPLPTQMGDTIVRVDGIPAPLFYVSPAQINFQIPFELMGQAQASITIFSSGLVSRPFNIALTLAAPALFSTTQSGSGQGAIFIAGANALAAPTGSAANARPARRGEIIAIFCTGLGAVSNQPKSGEAAASGHLSISMETPKVTIGSAPATVRFAGLAPDFVGLYQVNAEIPVNAALGSAIFVQLSSQGINSNIVTISVEN